MPKYHGREGFNHDSTSALGILVVNLGSPDAPTRSAVRRYLAEFLGDPRVVEIPQPIWWLILHGIVLNTRPSKSAHAYQQIWTEGGSPLIVTSQRVCDQLRQQYDSDQVHIELAMRYGNPSIRDALSRLDTAGINRLLVLPMYPQYSGSTTGTVFDEVASVLKTWRWVPELRMINSYHDHSAYIDTLAHSIREHWVTHERGQQLVISFHGLPKRFLLQGDPYFCQCHKTARLLADKLELVEDEWQIVFQSRFGRAEWLQPYCDQTLQSLPAQGVKRVDVVCPGFSIDCLETLEEQSMRNRDLFLAAGGETLNVIPCLNDSPEHVTLLAGLIADQGAGWNVTGTPARSAEITKHIRQLGGKTSA